MIRAEHHVVNLAETVREEEGTRRRKLWSGAGLGLELHRVRVRNRVQVRVKYVFVKEQSPQSPDQGRRAPKGHITAN